MTQRTRESWEDVLVIAKHVGASVLCVLGVLSLAWVAATLAGCRSISVTTPDGLKVDAGSLLTDPMLEGLTLKTPNGEFTVTGYKSKSQELGQIIGTAIKNSK